MAEINYTECINPVSGEVIGKSPLHSVESLPGIIEIAGKAQTAWAAKSVAERSQLLLSVRDYIVKNSDQIADVISSDNGKTRIDALVTEVLPAAMAVSYYCRNAGKFLKDEKLKSGNILLANKRSKIIRVPYGVVAIISPWNYPFSIPFSDIVSALLAGNAVILKTASETQLVGLKLKEVFDSAGLPEGIFNFINLPGRIAGDAFLNAGIDKLFFTGSVEIGKKLMAKAAESLTPISLELGGNDAMIVCGDADISRAASGAVWAAFQNAGQSCGGVERIYVHSKIYGAFLSELKEKTEKLNIGNGSELSSDLGCMTTKKQIDTVNLHISDALEKGARVFAKSQLPQSDKLRNLMPAVVLTEVNHDMLVMQEETFGPVVGVMKFQTVDEAVALANDSCLGLTASVWTRNNGTGESIARRIKAGVVTINDHLMSHGLPETPWGGFKQSGIGRTHGRIGFEQMTQPQTVVKDILPFVKKDLWWHPFDEKLYRGLRGLLDFLYAKNLSSRLAGFGRLIRILPRMFRDY